MHEHCSSDRKRVFVDSRILPLSHARQVENPLAQFLMKLCLRFHNRFPFFCGCFLSFPVSHYRNYYSISSFHPSTITLDGIVLRQFASFAARYVSEEQFASAGRRNKSPRRLLHNLIWREGGNQLLEAGILARHAGNLRLSPENLEKFTAGGWRVFEIADPDAMVQTLDQAAARQE